MWYITNNRQIRSSCLTKSMATVQVIHISMLCCHILHPNNCAAVLSHFRSTLKRQLYADKDSRCGTLKISSPLTFTTSGPHWNRVVTFACNRHWISDDMHACHSVIKVYVNGLLLYNVPHLLSLEVYKWRFSVDRKWLRTAAQLLGCRVWQQQWNVNHLHGRHTFGETIRSNLSVGL